MEKRSNGRSSAVGKRKSETSVNKQMKSRTRRSEEVRRSRRSAGIKE